LYQPAATLQGLSHTIEGTFDGTWSFRVRAYDALGNPSTYLELVDQTLLINTTPPADVDSFQVTALDFDTQELIGKIQFKELQMNPPNYFFVNKNFEEQKKYDEGFSLSELLTKNNVGIATAKDAVLINEKSSNLINEVEKYYSIQADEGLIKEISYRLFDSRYIYYDTKIVERAREKIMTNFLVGENIGISLCKQFKTGDNYSHCFISNKMIESSYVSNRTSEITSIFPLYLYPDHNGQHSTEESKKEYSRRLSLS
jgi:hypothetical protein